MIDTLQIYEELKDEITPSAAKKIAEAIGKVYSELLNTVTKEEFRELKETVAELAEAQRRTEERVNELAEAQKRTEERVNELAEAQKRTEEEIRKLTIEHRKTREHLGGLTHTVGYILEDRAYKGLPELLRRDFGIDLTSSLKRDYIEISPGRYEELNIIGKGRHDSEEVLIVGECKTQLKKRDIDSFLKVIRKINDFLPKNKILLTVTYQASPVVREYAKQKGIKLYFSYEMPL